MGIGMGCLGVDGESPKVAGGATLHTMGGVAEGLKTSTPSRGKEGSTHLKGEAERLRSHAVGVSHLNDVDHRRHLEALQEAEEGLRPPNVVEPSEERHALPVAE